MANQGSSQAPAAPVAAPALNPDFNWLTFETRFNSEWFKKTNQQQPMGLFIVPLWTVDVDVDNDAPDELLLAIFPNCTPDEVRQYANWCKQWRRREPTTAYWPGLEMTPGSGDWRELWVVAPYNYKDNDEQSTAFGTKPIPDISMFALEDEWCMWKTASRSCVVRMRGKNNQPARIEVGKQTYGWSFGHEDTDAKVGAFSPDREGDSDGPTVFDNRVYADDRYIFSFKTGVRYIGREFQEEKQKIEKVTPRLRSDYIAAMDKLLTPDNDIGFMRELLNVTLSARALRDDSVMATYGGGYDVRDLSLIKNKNRVFVPPLSIPYEHAGELIVVKHNQLNNTQYSFDEFWKKHYAEALGRLKAKLLVRYGLQCLTPNPQNFLIEFEREKLEPTGRIIIRDLGDLQLHKQIIFALHSNDVLNTDPTQLTDLSIQYEYKYVTSPQDTEVNRGIDAQRKPDGKYPAGTQLYWHAYSAFKAWKSEPAMITPYQNAMWGRAHNAAYVACLNQCLKLNTPLDIEQVNQPDLLFQKDARVWSRIFEEFVPLAWGHWKKLGVDAPSLIRVVEQDNRFDLTAWDLLKDTRLTATEREVLAESLLNLELRLEILQAKYLHRQLTSREGLQKIKEYNLSLRTPPATTSSRRRGAASSTSSTNTPASNSSTSSGNPSSSGTGSN
jgi:hypothetical protein